MKGCRGSQRFATSATVPFKDPFRVRKSVGEEAAP